MGSALNKFRLSARQVGVRYRGGLVLQGVSLDLQPGRIMAIIGPSGCGKTSFLNALNRMTDFIPGCKVEGEVFLGDQDIRTIPAKILRRQVGMIFQRPNPFPLSVRKNLELPLREHGMKDSTEIEKSIEGCLTAVGLWRELKDSLDRSALELSGGQKQRLCIARALTMQPDFLLMDEPCSALDPISGGMIEDLLVSLLDRVGIAIVTHNLQQAKRIAHDLAMFWVYDGVGGLVETGVSQNLFASPSHPMTAAYVQGLQG